ncbi:MAG TPA: hypothetical protein PLA50_00305 [Bacteroidia bacterium]|nr:hypothetical protein [Bacteroidia bacterium]
MIALLSISLFAAEGASSSALSPEPLIALLTGSGGALIAMWMWNRSLIADKKEMNDQHKEKDARLMGITREAIECIQATVSSREAEGEFRDRIEGVLARIEQKL